MNFLDEKHKEGISLIAVREGSQDFEKAINMTTCEQPLKSKNYFYIIFTILIFCTKS